MSTINNPDIDPANNYSLVGTINFAFQKLMQSMNGMLPAQVTDYDRETNRVSLQILINLVTTDNQQVPRPHLVNIPVLVLGGGNFSISFPLKSGDLGWVLACDRDISLFLQTYAQTAPNTYRMNNFADGLFIPDIMRSYNINSDNEDYLIIQSTNGDISVQMGMNTSTGANEINILADRVNIALNNTSTGLVTINGNLDVSGAITAVGQVSGLGGTILPSSPISPFPPAYPP